jgi:tetratricopeptide (TPR) repeat protein
LEEVGFKLQYLGEQAHHPLFLGVAQMTLANACFLRLKMKAGLELINKAIEYLGHTKDKKIMMEAKLRQAAIYYWTMEYDQAILTCQEVLKMGESLEASNHNINEYLFFARHSISYSYYAKGNANKALHHATTIYHHYFHQLSAFNRVRTYTMLAIANLIAANYQESQWFSEEGLKIAQMLENPFVTQILLTTQSKGEAIQGFLDEAFAHATKALKLGEEQNYTHTIISANRVIGDIYRYLQNYSLALQYYRVAQLRGGYSNDTIYTLDNDLSLASALAWMGQVAEARSLVQHAFEVTREKGMTQLHAGALLKLALCDLIERNLSGAEANILQAERLALDNGLVYELVWCQVGYARIALSRKQFDVAQKAIERILKTSDQRNLVWMKLRGLNFCSQLHNATQEPSLLRYRSERQALLQFLSEHTQSDSLQNDFTTAKKYWEEGHTYP